MNLMGKACSHLAKDSQSFGMHAMTIMMSLIFWGMLWGIIGALLAVPLTVMVKIILDKYESTRPISELLAGRVGGRA